MPHRPALPHSSARYSRVAVALHWLIALFILLNLGMGWFMEGFAPGLKMLAIPFHISCGLSVLVLSAVRVVWRLLNPPPAHDPPLAPAEERLAHVVHFLLYAGMVLMPLTGWALVSAHPAPGSAGFAAEQAEMAARRHAATGKAPGVAAKPPAPGGLRAWWVIPVSPLPIVQDIGETPGGLASQKRVHDRLVNWHSMGGYLMIALLALHLAGVCKHGIFDRKPVLARMGWRLPRSATGEVRSG